MSPEDRKRLRAALTATPAPQQTATRAQTIDLLNALDAIADVVEATRARANGAAVPYVHRARAFAEIERIVDGMSSPRCEKCQRLTGGFGCFACQESAAAVAAFGYTTEEIAEAAQPPERKLMQLHGAGYVATFEVTGDVATPVSIETFRELRPDEIPEYRRTRDPRATEPLDFDIVTETEKRARALKGES